MTLEQFKRRAEKIPEGPGVYFFLAKNKKVLYIGKATSLRSRVRSYFASDLPESRGPLLPQMLKSATGIDWRATDSVLEALLLEASLIRSRKPPYNTELKDDKSFNHVVITKEDFPRILTVRGKELKVKTLKQNSRKSDLKALRIFGPFPHGLQLREAIKLIRKIFPYRDTCTPCQPQGLTWGAGVRKCNPCFNAQIGLCPGMCSGIISKKEYRKIIRHIILLFEGKKTRLIKSLECDMRAATKVEDFERAKELRRQLFALQHIQDISLIKDEYKNYGFTKPIHSRIEGYDIAHLRGSANVGVMTVVEGNAANKNEYRKFRIKTAAPGDDVGALREVLARRLAHDEWPWPALFVVDGGKAQMNAMQKILDEHAMKIPVVGVVKDEKHRPRGILGDRSGIAGREREILLANAEAHRFAIAYHRKKLRAGRPKEVG